MNFYANSKIVKEGEKMPNQLRRGMENLKQFYINKLVTSGIYHTSDKELYSFTLSELESIVKKEFTPKE
jgi:hypothetical protein